MTLVLAGIANAEGVLAADTLVKVIRPDGSHYFDHVPKLFAVRGCAVASVGQNPPGIHIPTFVDGFTGLNCTPGELATLLHDEICARSTPTEPLSLLIGGSGPTEIEFWEATPPNGVSRIVPVVGAMIARGTVPPIPPLPVYPDASALMNEMHSIFGQVAQQFPHHVGAPFDFAVLELRKPPVIARDWRPA
jgi:hypothetical protein